MIFWGEVRKETPWYFVLLRLHAELEETAWRKPNLDVILRTSIPVKLQGRVYACRNTLQYFTIPVGLFLGGFMVDQVCEPFMSLYGDNTVLRLLFGMGKSSRSISIMKFLIEKV